MVLKKGSNLKRLACCACQQSLNIEMCGGQVEVNERVVTVLKKGSYFGEIGLLRTCRRTASIRAISETVDLFVLSKVASSLYTYLKPCLEQFHGTFLHINL